MREKKLSNEDGRKWKADEKHLQPQFQCHI